jgi:hypothetical protein
VESGFCFLARTTVPRNRLHQLWGPNGARIRCVPATSYPLGKPAGALSWRHAIWFPLSHNLLWLAQEQLPAFYLLCHQIVLCVWLLVSESTLRLPWWRQSSVMDWDLEKHLEVTISMKFHCVNFRISKRPLLMHLTGYKTSSVRMTSLWGAFTKPKVSHIFVCVAGGGGVHGRGRV